MEKRWPWPRPCRRSCYGTGKESLSHKWELTAGHVAKEPPFFHELTMIMTHLIPYDRSHHDCPSAHAWLNSLPNFLFPWSECRTVLEFLLHVKSRPVTCVNSLETPHVRHGAWIWSSVQAADHWGQWSVYIFGDRPRLPQGPTWQLSKSCHDSSCQSLSSESDSLLLWYRITSL